MSLLGILIVAYTFVVTCSSDVLSGILFRVGFFWNTGEGLCGEQADSPYQGSSTHPTTTNTTVMTSIPTLDSNDNTHKLNNCFNLIKEQLQLQLQLQ